ncbi:MAG: polysaccharide deacetylase family protein, partial [Planctomycetota bacterium]
MTFRSLVKEVLYNGMHLAGLTRRRASRLRPGFVVLTYHSFHDGVKAPHRQAIDVGLFARQIRFLRGNFDVRPLEELVAGKTGGDRPALAITVDDGFRDNFELMWPVLAREKTPATIFLTTDFLDNGRPPWPVRLREILNTTTKDHVRKPVDLRLRSPSDRAAAAGALKRFLAPLAPAQR